MSVHNLTAKQTGEKICITKVSLPTQSLTSVLLFSFKKRTENTIFMLPDLLQTSASFIRELSKYDSLKSFHFCFNRWCVKLISFPTICDWLRIVFVYVLMANLKCQ